MDEKDPSPFGYTFSAGGLSADLYGNASTDFDNGGPPLLNDDETQRLDNFFSQNPFGSDAAPSAFDFSSQTPGLLDTFSGWSAVPPATIHNISTTIPDQALLHGFHTEQNFTTTHHPNLFASTADDLQAASTLYAQAHIPQSLPAYQHQQNGRSHSFHGVPSTAAHTNGYGSNGIPHGLPLVPTPATSNGLMHEQLAALLPHHDVPGSIDNTITSQLANSNARAAHEAGLRERAPPSLKRAYTYGTDSSFNESGFQPSSEHENEEVVTKRLIRELHHAQPLARPAPAGTNGTVTQSPTGHIHLRGGSDSDEEDVSDESSADDDEEKRMKKRRKRPPPAMNGKRKSVSGAASSKNRKMSVDDRVKKPRRKSMASSKPQRENLTEEQKRSNHILSEQKKTKPY